MTITILRYGNIKHDNTRFKCDRCDTIFLASPPERVYVENSQYSYYTCKCPECSSLCQEAA